MNILAQTEEFLRRHRMFYADIDMGQSCRTFIEEMENGLNGRPGTLKMIPTYIRLDKKIDYRKNAVVMDAGGTNFRVGLVHFQADGQPVIDYLKKYPMPGAQGEIGKEEFFDQVVEYLSPVIDRSSRIGFCFSYPTEIMPNRDGKLIRFDKEVKVRGMEGETIGENLAAALRRKGFSGKNDFVLINDTVATLLGGISGTNDRDFDSYIGFILGTGTNTCYLEENRNIRKNEWLSGASGSSVINIESGGYGKIPGSDIDEAFDSRTEDPGMQLFEKMISGAYQGGLLLAILKQAARENLFSARTAEKILQLSRLEATEIDRFCYYPYGQNPLAQCADDEAGRIAVYYLIDALIERAARLVAINLAAVMLKTGKGQNPCRPVCISAEGSTFYKSKLFRGKLDSYVSHFMNRELGIWCEFVNTDNSTIIGTALAGILE